MLSSDEGIHFWSEESVIADSPKEAFRKFTEVGGQYFRLMDWDEIGAHGSDCIIMVFDTRTDKVVLAQGDRLWRPFSPRDIKIK